MLKTIFFILLTIPVLVQCGTKPTESRTSRLPFYDVTAPDGSRHYMLGTIHLGVGLDDLSEEVIAALDTADVYVAEMTTAGMERWLQDTENDNTPIGHSLRQQLGEQYWLALRQQLSTINAQELDRMTVEDVSSKLLELTAAKIESEKLLLDLQINNYGEQLGKKIIGLDEHIAPSLLRQEIQALMGDINALKKTIRCGGIPCLQTTLTKMRTAWLQGDLKQMERLTTVDGKVGKYYRDQAWVRTGIVQNNCRQGNTCLIYVGAAHLFEYYDSFITLLRQNGYQIEKYHRPAS